VPTLGHLAKQVVDDTIAWEVILVNNVSSDNTVAVAKETWDKANTARPLIIAEQPIAGLSFAREKGIETAKYEYLLYCDDDNWLEENYIQKAFEIMKQQPKVAALGGLGIPVCELNPPPAWFNKYSGIYATGPQGYQDGELSVNNTLYGACAVYRRSALTDIFNKGFSFHLSGRSKEKLTTGEDRELCYALSLNGYKLYYSSALKFYHFIPASRLTEQYRDNVLLGASNANYALTAYQLLVSNAFNKRPSYKNSWQWIIFMRAVLTIKTLFKELLSNNFQSYNYYWAVKDTVAFYKNRKEYNSLFCLLKKQFIH